MGGSPGQDEPSSASRSIADFSVQQRIGDQPIFSYVFADSLSRVVAIVQAIAPRVALGEQDWLHPTLTASPPTVAPRGPADREHPERADLVLVVGKARAVDVPFADYGARLEEIAVEDLLARQERAPDADAATLWGWAITEAEAAADEDDA